MAGIVTLSPDHAFAHLPGYGWGSHVVTGKGEVPVDWLAPGDMLVTRDHGLQPLLWIGHQRSPGISTVRAAGRAFGNAPSHETRLAPGTRILVSGWEVELHTGEAEALATVRALNGAGEGGQAGGLACVLLPVHGLVQVNGLWVETLLLDPAARALLADALPPSMLARPDVIAGHRRAVRYGLHDWEVAAMRGAPLAHGGGLVDLVA